MADTLKAKLNTVLEAEHIRDLDLADPVRNLVLEDENAWDSGNGDCTYGGANRIWIKEITMPVGVGGRYVFDLLNGTYGPVGGPFVSMLDGFGQTVTFEQVAVLQIEGISPNEADDTACLMASAANNWNWLMDGFAAASFVRFRGLAKLTFSCGDRFKWDVAALAGSAASMTFRITILGYHS
jgi:hypothetical protein